VELLRTIRFRTSRDSVVLTVEEAKEFQYRLSQAPGGRPLEHQIRLAIADRTDVTISNDHKAAAMNVLAAWFDEAGEVSREMGELLVLLREG
jgi:hypothetical protein